MKAVTHKGLDVDLVFFEQDPEDMKGLNEGWVCHRVEAQVDGEVVGYLKIEYVPSRTLDEKLPTIWHWWNSTSWRADDLAAVWFDAHWACQLIPESLRGHLRSYLRLSRKEHTPHEEDVIRADLAALEKRVRGRGYRDPWSDFETFKRNHLDRPKVAYVYTKHPSPWEEGTDWRRKGIATLLYTEGAKWVAQEKGLPLWASTLQQDCATYAWEHMKASGLYPVRMEACPWDPERQVSVLDYTGNVAHEDHGYWAPPSRHRWL